MCHSCTYTELRKAPFQQSLLKHFSTKIVANVWFLELIDKEMPKYFCFLIKLSTTFK